jgi:hypothetical protein
MFVMIRRQKKQRCLTFHSLVFSHNYNRLASSNSMGNCASAILNVANLFSDQSTSPPRELLLSSLSIEIEFQRAMAFPNSKMISSIVTYFNHGPCHQHYHIARILFSDRHQILLSADRPRLLTSSKSISCSVSPTSLSRLR